MELLFSLLPIIATGLILWSEISLFEVPFQQRHSFVLQRLPNDEQRERERERLRSTAQSVLQLPSRYNGRTKNSATLGCNECEYSGARSPSKRGVHAGTQQQKWHAEQCHLEDPV